MRLPARGRRARARSPTAALQGARPLPAEDPRARRDAPVDRLLDRQGRARARLCPHGRAPRGHAALDRVVPRQRTPDLMRALITGGSGYFGCLLRDRLVERGDTVRIFDLVDVDDRPASVEYVAGDIRDRGRRRARVRRRRRRLPQRRPGAAREGPGALLGRESRRHGKPARRRPRRARAEGRPHLDERRLRRPEKEPGRREHRADADGGVRQSQARRRAARHPLRRRARTRRDDHPAAYHRRPRPPRHLPDPLRLDRGRPEHPRARQRATTSTSSSTPTTSPTPASAPPAVPATPSTTSAPSASAPCARSWKRSAAMPAPGSRVYSVPLGLAVAAMRLTSALGLSPLGPYHSLMYGRSLYFDVEQGEARARLELALVERRDALRVVRLVPRPQGRDPGRQERVAPPLGAEAGRARAGATLVVTVPRAAVRDARTSRNSVAAYAS